MNRQAGLPPGALELFLHVDSLLSYNPIYCCLDQPMVYTGTSSGQANGVHGHCCWTTTVCMYVLLSRISPLRIHSSVHTSLTHWTDLEHTSKDKINMNFVTAPAEDETEHRNLLRMGPYSTAQISHPWSQPWSNMYSSQNLYFSRRHQRWTGEQGNVY